MKELQELKETKALSKKEQQAVKGGRNKCFDDIGCPEGYGCDDWGICRLIALV